MWAPLPPLGWQYLSQDAKLVVGEYLFRPGWVALVALAAALFLWRAGGAGLTAELARACAALLARRRAVLAALVLASAGASVALNLGPLGGHPHTQDEVAYLFQARTFAQGRLAQPLPPEGLIGAFQTVFLLADGDRWYSKYPFGWPLVLALPAKLGLAWLVNPLFNALALLLFFALVRKNMGEGAALAATALLATSPFFIFMGASYLTHPLTLVLLLAILHGVDGLPRASGFALVAAGTGCIHLVRPLDAVALGLPAYLLAFRAWWGDRRATTLAVLVAVPLACLAATLAYNHALTGDALLSPFLKHYPYDRPGFGPEVGTFDHEGHNAFKGLLNLAFNMVALSEDLYGWPGLALAVIAFGVIAPPVWSSFERLLLWTSALVGLQYFTFMGHGIAFGPRYYHAWLPVLAVFTLRAGEELLRRAGDETGRPRLALIAGLWTMMGLVTYWPARVDALRDYWNLLSHPAELARAAAPPDAGIVVVPDVKWVQRDLFDSFFDLNGGDLASARPLYVRDGPWVADGRLARAFPGRTIARIPLDAAKRLLEPGTN